ncbi:hypothetical protein [Novosphingobium sp. 9U]|uniref:hypothetical protein n=1 Tax=Novosphingobium sp. 9U TaxID=2653158 RepID=UPI0012EF6423|nr:hypothetical protein [Novosphingobium sp. 9U]VWX46623.1 hypothetical protein NOVOSPHI9U_10163 [Novosphingobium sp. 9U]
MLAAFENVVMSSARRARDRADVLFLGRPAAARKRVERLLGDVEELNLTYDPCDPEWIAAGVRARAVSARLDRLLAA